MLKSPASCALGEFCPAETEVEMVTSLPNSAYVFGCVFFCWTCASRCFGLGSQCSHSCLVIGLDNHRCRAMS